MLKFNNKGAEVMKKWEYRVLKINREVHKESEIERELESYGKSGWELVSVTPQISSYTDINGGLDVSIDSTVYYFKRELMR